MSKLKHHYGLDHLHYMRNERVKRGFTKHPGVWPWASRRFYFWNHAFILAMDKMV